MKKPNPNLRTAWTLCWVAPAAMLAFSCNQQPAGERQATPAALSTADQPPRPTPAPSLPVADPALKQKLLALMSGYEHIVTKGELDRLGEPSALTAALLALHRDPEVHLAVRTNALANLRFYPSATSRAALEGALLATDTPDVIRRSAVKAYGAGFGQDAVPVLAKALENPEIHTRNLAAKTLLQIGGSRASEALRHRLPNEREALVKSTIEAGLRQP